MGDLLGVVPAGIVFGRSADRAVFRLLANARQVVAGRRRGRRDPPRPRQQHPPLGDRRRSCRRAVTMADFEPQTGDLPAIDIAHVVSERTRLIAVTGASNLHRYPARPVRPRRPRPPVGALLYVDGVHLTAHVLTDVRALGADFCVCSPYKFLGPHSGCSPPSPRCERSAGEAAAGHRRRARTVRAGDPAVRTVGRHDGGGRLPCRPRPRRHRHETTARRRVDDDAGALRGRASYRPRTSPLGHSRYARVQLCPAAHADAPVRHRGPGLGRPLSVPRRPRRQRPSWLVLRPRGVAMARSG